MKLVDQEFGARQDNRKSFPKAVLGLFAITVLGASLSGQTTSAITLNMTVSGTGNLITGYTLNGSGTVQPFGNATVKITSPSAAGGSALVSFTFTFPTGDTLLASSTSVTAGTSTIQGTAFYTGGTGQFKSPSGSFNFQLSGTAGTTITNAALTGNGSITLPTASSTSLQASPGSLQFSAVRGGNTPGSQTVSITAPGSTTGQFFTVTLDSGTTGSAAPGWLNVQPLSGTTPATLTVSVTAGVLPLGALTGRIHLTPSSTSVSPVDVTVTLNIITAPAQLSVAPAKLLFTATSGSSKLQEQSLLVRNKGGGSLSFTAAVVGKSSWIKDVTPSSGTTGPDLPVILRVHVNGQGLGVGIYTDIIRVTGSGTTTDVPVKLTVRTFGSALQLSATGVLFQVRQGSGSSDESDTSVLNAGDPGTTVSFTATLLSGADWAVLKVPKNQATTTSPGQIAITVNPNVATFPAGVRTALVRVVDTNSQNSPQFLTAVLQVDPAGSVAPPDPSPAGVFLLATAGQPNPSFPVTLNYSSTTPTAYQTSAATVTGGNWLSVAPLAGQVSTTSPANLNLSANTAGLKAGIYSGTVSIYIGSGLRTVHATLVVLAGAGSVAAPAARDATACLPQQLVVVQTELADNFVLLAGFPSLLAVQVNDDCGNPVLDASVVASFDNDDVPLRLDSDQVTGFYGASWTPSHVFPGMSITFDATHPTLLSPSTPTGNVSKVAEALNVSAAGAKLTGTVSPNSNPLPVLAVGGTVNNSNIVASAPLAPGTIASVYGNQLATTTSVTTGPPLPTQFQGTDIRTGNFSAPLFYVSPGQVNIQIPFELVPNQSYPVVATVNGVSSVPDFFSVAPATPAVIAFPDGTAKAQHGDGSFVTTSSPAKPGETLAIYLVGMGPTVVPVASGAGAPFNANQKVTFPPTVTVGGTVASLQFPGGLVGGAVGLYQINFTVPPNAPKGTLDLVVTQNGFTANLTKLIVSP